jgi:ATP-dependent DNA helicase DinG
VAAILSEALFDQVESCVLTSATLAVGGSFEFVKRRLGIQYARERALDSHFDFPRQALLYIPPELPDPRRPEFAERAAREVSRILKTTRGRAFVLFTSYQQMFQVYEMVSQQLRALCRRGARPAQGAASRAPTDAGLKYTLLLQGDAPRSALLDRFRREPNPVLFATASFWQGVDVPGEQLSCVIIDRLPFAVPTDPVVAARLRLIQEDGGNPFLEYQVPQAVISLKQGFGRLIRSRTDRGVLAILDTRILTKNYGTIFLESLPDYRSTRQIAEVERFMETAGHV